MGRPPRTHRRPRPAQALGLITRTRTGAGDARRTTGYGPTQSPGLGTALYRSLGPAQVKCHAGTSGGAYGESRKAKTDVGAIPGTPRASGRVWRRHLGASRSTGHAGCYARLAGLAVFHQDDEVAVGCPHDRVSQGGHQTRDGRLHRNPHAVPAITARLVSSQRGESVRRRPGDPYPGRGPTDLETGHPAIYSADHLKSRLVQSMPDLRDKLIHLTRHIPRLPAAGPFMPMRAGGFVDDL